MLAKARQQFHDLMDRIAPADKVAYAMALERCPHLIKLESNPDYYLESARGDAYAACRRVLGYWSLRLEWFGEERAFLPMNLSGTGALTPADIDVLHTGFMMLLPEDNMGRAVAFHDRARLTNPDVMDVPKRKRCIFYVLSVASESASCRQNGLVFLSAFCDKTRKSTFDLQMLSDKVALMKKEVLPYHFVGLHIVMLSQRPILNMVVPMTVQAFEKMDCLKRGIVVHSRKPTEQLLEDFKRHGFDPESIPKVPFGGFWTLGCFRRWLDDRKLREKKVYCENGVHHHHPDGETEHHHPHDSHDSGGSDPEDNGSEDNEQLRKKRKMGAAYARRKRARNKIEMEVMHAEVDRLRKQQDDLAFTSRVLEQLLQDAQDIANRVDADPDYAASVTGQYAPVAPESAEAPSAPSAPPKEPEESFDEQEPASQTTAVPPTTTSSSFMTNPDLGSRLGRQGSHYAAVPFLQDVASMAAGQQQQSEVRLLRQLMASMVQQPQSDASSSLHGTSSLGLLHHINAAAAASGPTMSSFGLPHRAPFPTSAAANHQLLLSLLAGVTNGPQTGGGGPPTQQQQQHPQTSYHRPSPTELLLASATGQHQAVRPLASSSGTAATGAGQDNLLRTLCSVFGSGPSASANEQHHAQLRAFVGAQQQQQQQQHQAALHHHHHGHHTAN